MKDARGSNFALCDVEKVFGSQAILGRSFNILYV